jgi:sugar/nucleoside kinase (ribokinase family)
MFDVVCVGNATIDVFISLKGTVKKGKLLLETGTKKEVDSIFYSTGGGATNTAVGFRRLGLKVGVLAAVGNDPGGKIVLRELRREEVSTRLVTRLSGYDTAYSAILTGFGADRIILVYGGATRHLEEERRIHWDWLRGTKWLHVSSFHAEPKVLEKILEFAEKNGISVSFNPGMSEVKLGLKKLAALLKKVDILLLNRHEAGLLTKEKQVKKQLKKLQVLAPLVVVTEGSKGAHAFDGSYYYKKPAYRVKVFDTTGAGDAFHSGFVAAIAKGHSVEKAMDFGTANAQSVIMYLGAKNRLLTTAQLSQFIEEHETKETAVKKEKIQ